MTRKIKKAYTRTRVTTDVKERSTKAVQSEKKHTDINNIVSKAYKTGQLPILMNRQPVEQLPDALTYQDALNKVVNAQQQFERLPSNIRDHFENNPQKMLSAIDKSAKDPVIKKQLQEIGVVEPSEPEITPAKPLLGGEATAKPQAALAPVASEGGETSNA